MAGLHLARCTLPASRQLPLVIFKKIAFTFTSMMYFASFSEALAYEGCKNAKMAEHQSEHCLFTFCVSRRRRKMYCGHARLCVCLFVCLSVRGRIPTLLHGPGCNLGEW